MTAMELSLIIKMLVAGFVMGVSSRLLGEWIANYKTLSMEMAGRLIFWGGGTAIAAIIGGMPFEQSLALIPTGIAGLVIPTLKEQQLKSIYAIRANIELVMRSFIAFTPLMLMLWLYGYSWPKIIFVALSFPFLYSLSNIIPSKIWNMTKGEELNEVLVGFALGVDLVLTIAIPWTVWPGVPDMLKFIDN